METMMAPHGADTDMADNAPAQSSPHNHVPDSTPK